MKPTDFQRCLCLNLDRKPERWKGFCHRKEAVKDWPFPEVERYSGVDGYAVTAPAWWKERPGAWGCTASYAKILDELRLSGDDAWLCFEDDAMFKPDLRQRAERYLSEIPDDWDILYLGCLHWIVYRDPPKQQSREVLRPSRATGTHAWAIRGRFAETVRNWILTPVIPDDVGLQQVDQRLALLQMTGLHNIYAPMENIVGQAENVSDISGHVVGPCYWDLLSDVTGPLMRDFVCR